MRRGGTIKRRAKRRTPAEIADSLLWHRDVMRKGFALSSATERVAGLVPEYQAHHLIPQQVLRRRARDLDLPNRTLVWDVRIGVIITKRRHERHHAGLEPVRWDELPRDAAYFAQHFAVEHGLEPWLERHMPGYSRRASVRHRSATRGAVESSPNGEAT